MRTAASSFADRVPSTAASDQHHRVPVPPLVQKLEVLGERRPGLPAVPLQHHPALGSDEPQPRQRIQGLLRGAERIRRGGENPGQGAGEPGQRPPPPPPPKRGAIPAAQPPPLAPAAPPPPPAPLPPRPLRG